MKSRINILVWLIVIIASYFCLAPTYRCDRGTKCSENGCQAQPGESTVGCTKILKQPYWTKTDNEPWPQFAYDWANIDYTGASESWSGADLEDCREIHIQNRGEAQVVYLVSLSNPWSFYLPAKISNESAPIIVRKVNREFDTVYFEPAAGETDGNVTIWSYK